MMTSLPAAILTLAMAASQGFVPIGQKQGVEVFQRQNVPDIELIADGEIDAPPSVVQAVLIDYGAHPRIIRRLAQSRVLVQGASELVVYQRLKLPVIADRDYTLRVTWGADGAVRTTRFRTANEQGPLPSRGAVRLPMMDGGWDLTPIRGGQATRARYHFKIDFGGSVPRWMVRSGAAKDLPSLFEGVRYLVSAGR